MVGLISKLSQNEIIEEIDFESVIENILPQQEFDIDYNDFYDRLFSLYSNPLDLNNFDRSEFQVLLFLSEEQISGIVKCREEFEKILSLFELLTIEAFDQKTVLMLSQFVAIYHNEKESLKLSLKKPEIHDLFMRHQTIFEKRKDLQLLTQPALVN